MPLNPILVKISGSIKWNHWQYNGFNFFRVFLEFSFFLTWNTTLIYPYIATFLHRMTLRVGKTVTLRVHSFVWNVWENSGNFAVLVSSKLVHLYAKKCLFSLTFSAKIIREDLKAEMVKWCTTRKFEGFFASIGKIFIF